MSPTSSDVVNCWMSDVLPTLCEPRMSTSYLGSWYGTSNVTFCVLFRRLWLAEPENTEFILLAWETSFELLSNVKRSSWFTMTFPSVENLRTRQRGPMSEYRLGSTGGSGKFTMHLGSFWLFFDVLLAFVLPPFEVGKLLVRVTGSCRWDFLFSTDVSLECRFLVSTGGHRFAGEGVLVLLPLFDVSVTCNDRKGNNALLKSFENYHHCLKPLAPRSPN